MNVERNKVMIITEILFFSFHFSNSRCFGFPCLLWEFSYYILMLNWKHAVQKNNFLYYMQAFI